MSHFAQLRAGCIRALLLHFRLVLVNRSIDVAPVGSHWMNYVTVSVGYEGDCAREKVFGAAVVTTGNVTSIFTYTGPYKSSMYMRAAQLSAGH